MTSQAPHRLSRRTLLSALGAGATAIAIQACAPAASPSGAPAADSGAAQPAAAEATAVNVIYWADSNDAFKTVMDAFTAETGKTVNYEVAPADYLEWQQLMTTRFASGDKGTDAFHCDDFQAAIYGSAGWLTPLEATVEKYSIDLSDWPQTLVTDVSAWNGTLYRIPWGNDTEIFLYRTDFFAEAGVQPPTTWSELLEVASVLTQGEERYGITLSGKNNGVLGNDIQHWANQAGGAINALDKPGSREALLFYKALFAEHKVAPPSVPQDDYGASLQGFLDNKYAMWWVWDGFYGTFRNNPDFWNDQVAAFLPPKGPDNAQTVTGCWGWSINAQSENQDAASEWVAFTARPEIMKMQILRGRVPARISLWSDPEVQDKAPSAPFLQQLAEAGDLVKARPVTPSIQEIYDAAEQNIHAFLTDQVDVDQAINDAMAKITPILDRDMGK